MNELIKIFENEKMLAFNYLVGDEIILQIDKKTDDTLNYSPMLDYYSSNKRLFFYYYVAKLFNRMNKSDQLGFLKFLENKFTITISETNLEY